MYHDHHIMPRLVAFAVFSVLLGIVPLSLVRILLSITDPTSQSRTGPFTSILQPILKNANTRPLLIGFIGVACVNILLVAFVLAAWREGPSSQERKRKAEKAKREITNKSD